MNTENETRQEDVTGEFVKQAGGDDDALSSRAAGATWWSTLEITARFGIQFLVLVILARLLEPSDFGLVAMVLVFTTLCQILVDSGFSTALIQRQRATKDDETTVFVFSSATGLLLAGLLWFTAPLISDFYSQPDLTSLTRMLALVLPLSALAAVPDALLAMRLEFKVRARAEFLASSCAGAVALWLAFNGHGAWSLVWQTILAAALRAGLLWSYTGWRPRGRFSRTSFKSLFRFGGYMMLSNLLDTVSLRLQSLMIGRLFDSRTLGYYTVAQNTQQAPVSFFSTVLNRVGLPVFSSLATQISRLRAALAMTMKVSMFLFFPVMVGVAVIAEPVVNLLYGEQWTPAAPILGILALSAALWPMHVLNLTAINSLGRSDLFFRLTMIKKTILISLIILLSPAGPVGIASAVLISSVIALFMNSYYTRKLIGYGILAQLMDQRGTLVLSAFSGLSGWMMISADISEALGIPLSIIAASATYISGALLSKHPALSHIMSIAKSARSS